MRITKSSRKDQATVSYFSLGGHYRIKDALQKCRAGTGIRGRYSWKWNWNSRSPLAQIALKRNFEIFKLSFNKAGIQENDMLRKVAIDMKTFRARENKMQF